MNLNDFLASSIRNQWLRERNISVYMRKSKRLLNGQFFSALDVASIEVDSLYRGRGIFTGFLRKVEIKAQSMGLVVFVESVGEPRLIPFLQKRGYIQDLSTMGSIAPSFFR